MVGKLSFFRLILIFLSLCISGLVTLPLLDIGLFPRPDGVIITVNYNISDRTPELNEQLVTSILENSFSVVRGIQSIESVSGYNYGSIQLTLDSKEDADFIRMEVSAIIRRLFAVFPAGISWHRALLFSYPKWFLGYFRP